MKFVYFPVFIFFSCINNPLLALPLSEMDEYQGMEADLDSVNSVLSQSGGKLQSDIFSSEASTGNSKRIPAIIKGDDFYLFEQDELNAQEEGLDLYQTIYPMFSPEMKKDAKKIWAETEDYRKNIKFSTIDSDSKELILKKSPKEMTLIKGKSAEEISNNNLPPGAHDEKGSDNVMVMELYDNFYDLLKKAFLVILGILILGKIVILLVNTLIKGGKKRKKRKKRKTRSPGSRESLSSGHRRHRTKRRHARPRFKIS